MISAVLLSLFLLVGASSCLGPVQNQKCSTAQDLIDIGPIAFPDYKTLHTMHGVLQVVGFHFLSDGTYRVLCYIESDDKVYYYGDPNPDARWKRENGQIYLPALDTETGTFTNWINTGTVQSFCDPNTYVQVTAHGTHL